MPNDHVLRAIVSDTRRQIIQELSKGSRTPSDLSRILGKHKSTVVEHLRKLMEVGLVSRSERPGRKWVFYSLTNQGSGIINKRTSQIMIIFSLMIMTIVSGSFSLYKYYSQPMLVKSVESLPARQDASGGEITTLLESRVFLYTSIVLFGVAGISFVGLIFLKKKNTFEVWG